MNEKNYEIVNLIRRFLLNDLSEDEQRMLDAWREESEEREFFFQRILAGEEFKDRQEIYRKSVALDAYKRFQCKNRKRRMNAFWRWVAVICLPLLVGGIWVLVDRVREKSLEIAEKTLVTSEPEVRDKVILVLADGEKVGVSAIGQDCLRMGAAVVLGNEGKLIYDSEGVSPDSAVVAEPEVNKVITNTGGFYSLILSDGTRVWLNSESELEYSVLFSSGERVVRLVGEAFFEVTQDAARPFIVETSDMRMRVLGTSFNIKAYKDASRISTTLFTGKVQVTPLADVSHKVVLVPGQQAVWDLQTRQFSVVEANLEHVGAWKNGLFVFHEENIEVVARQIERWYGVKFVYRLDRREQYTLNGYFSKDESLKTLLDIFTFISGLEFEMDGNIVYVKNKME